MKCKEIQKQGKVNLQLKNKKKVQKLKEKGITLIALVVTIIILLILAGVTLNMALSGDGLFSKAKLAVNKYDVASEEEVLQQQIIEYQMDNSIEKIGEKLSDKVSGVTDSDWKVIQLNNSDKNYGTNYYYVPKGKEIANYGKTKYNWVMNYETGEVINIEEYTVLDGNAGMSVKTNIALNINPINLNDKTSWGENVTFVYGKEENSENSGVHGAELKFDGKDDYLKVENVEIKEGGGFTFEFYGRGYGDIIFPIEKLEFDGKGIPCSWEAFRTNVQKDTVWCNIGNGECESPDAWETAHHWFILNAKDIFSKDKDIYFSLTVDIGSGKINLYYNDGVKLSQVSTTCSIEYLKSGALMTESIPFCIGVGLGGGNVPVYGEQDLYACRIYTKVLNTEEVNKNYNESVNYHKYLINDEQ